jgi:hypothetical protein
MKGMVFITVHPDQVARAALAGVDSVLAIGPEPETTLGLVCTALREPPLRLPPLDQEPGEVVFWHRQSGQLPFGVQLVPARTERIRHSRKYAEGELPPDRSFYFRGPKGQLNLRAQNLILFLQIADGVDDATWLHHLRRGDYSRWFRERIKDPVLADETETIEGLSDLPPRESRARIKQAIERYYTLPGSAPLPMPGTDVARARENPPQRPLSRQSAWFCCLRSPITPIGAEYDRSEHQLHDGHASSDRWQPTLGARSRFQGQSVVR